MRRSALHPHRHVACLEGSDGQEMMLKIRRGMRYRTLPATIAAMLRYLYQIVVLDSIAAMERCMDDPVPALRSPGFKAITALAAIAVLLILLNFVVLKGEVQADVADALWWFAIGLSDGAFKDAMLAASPLYRHAVWTLSLIHI